MGFVTAKQRGERDDKDFNSTLLHVFIYHL